jgi:secreted trypsin-like serine protease
MCGPSVFFAPPAYAPTSVCAKGSGKTSIPNSGDSGGPLLLRPSGGAYVEVGLTSLGADDHTKLYEEYTSIPAERAWIAKAIKSLRS